MTRIRDWPNLSVPLTIEVYIGSPTVPYRSKVSKIKLVNRRELDFLVGRDSPTANLEVWTP